MNDEPTHLVWISVTLAYVFGNIALTVVALVVWQAGGVGRMISGWF